MAQLKITPKWIAIIITILGIVWGWSATFTTLQTGQEQLQVRFDEHLSHEAAVIAELQSIKAVLDAHLMWDTLYVVSQGYFEERQQEELAAMKEAIKELKKR